MANRTALALIGGLGGLLFPATGQVQAVGREPVLNPPNVILFMTDDQGAGDGHLLGHPYLKTPNLDRLVREGTTFTQFYTASAVCSPSRAAFLSGKFPADLGIHHIFVTLGHAAKFNTAPCLPDVPTVMDLLKTKGYSTAHYGKWHLTAGGNYRAPTPAEYGLDEAKIGGGSGAMPVEMWEGAESKKGEADDPYYRAKSSGLFVDAAIDFIERHKDGPFFVNVWTLVPHAPLNPTPEELAVYADLNVSPDDFESYMKDYVAAAPNPQSQMATYCAAVTGMDIALGKLLDYLDESGLAENTVILFTSDNGPEDCSAKTARNAGMGSPGNSRGRKRSLYEGGIRVPFLVRWPEQVPAGRVDSTSVLNAVDVMPTLASLAGVAPDVLAAADSRGEDVSSAWRGESFSRSKPLFWEWQQSTKGDPVYNPPALLMRDGDWKLFCELDGSGAELYNIANDPEERQELAVQYPEVVQKLKVQLLSWKDSWPGVPTTARVKK